MTPRMLANLGLEWHEKNHADICSIIDHYATTCCATEATRAEAKRIALSDHVMRRPIVKCCGIYRKG